VDFRVRELVGNWLINDCGLVKNWVKVEKDLDALFARWIQKRRKLEKISILRFVCIFTIDYENKKYKIKIYSHARLATLNT
jgi:hypothetical protein